MSDEANDTLTITEDFVEDIRSEGADVLVAVSAWTFGKVSGQGVDAVRAALVRRGFAEGDLSLTNVEHTRWSWVFVVLGVGVSFAMAIVRQPGLSAVALLGGFVFAWSLRLLRIGNVTGTLQVRCADAAAISSAIETIVGFRNAELRSVTHRYKGADERADEWVVAAIERANVRARRIAGALGVAIVGVHRYKEERLGPTVAAVTPAAHVAPTRRKGKMTLAESLGPVSSTERAGVRVTVTYRIRGNLET